MCTAGPLRWDWACPAGAVVETPAAPGKRRLSRDLPKVIEVEPVIRRLTTVMRKPIRIALSPAADVVLALVRRQVNLFAEQFQVHVITPPSPVETEKHDNRHTDGVRQSHRAGRERRFGTEEIAIYGLALGGQPISHDTDDAAAVQALLNAQ